MIKEKKTLDFILVEERDAEFILKLRNDKFLGKYLSPTTLSVVQQREWITNYKKREADGLEYYFIVNINQQQIGIVRLYNINYSQKTCTFGSFIMHPNRPAGSTLETIRFALNYAFNLGMERVILDVRKNNLKAIQLYEYYGFQQYDDTELDFLYEIKF